ncbi:hypothetical protein COY27_01110 [Candidatus Woesearchaeota archaeon CG_4_10_14_0_2_um_filter_33_13]|nr:MAG: hypothetical protein COY27_01110 [Candidatus Woesearchaeota archaeon CG_4_10_14_0_2_um_filter_33_13]
MKYKKTTPTAKAYTFSKAKLSLPTNEPVVPNVFNGKLVYLAFKDYGFQPMIKVENVQSKEPIYYFPKDVIELKNDGFEYRLDNMPLTRKASSHTAVYEGFEDFKQMYPQYSSVTGEFTPSQVEDQYKKSGSKLSFGEWIKSEDGKKLVNDSLTLAFALLNKNQQQQQQTGVQTNMNNNELKPEKEFTILKMKPLTFALVSLATIGAIVLAIKYIPKTTKK